MHRRVRWTHYEGVSVYGCPNASSTQGKELSSLAIFSPSHCPHYTHHLKRRRCPPNSTQMAELVWLLFIPKGGSVYGWPKASSAIGNVHATLPEDVCALDFL